MRNTVLTILFIALTLLQLSCHPYRDRELEQRLTKALIEFKNSDAPYLDLNPIFGRNWEKICVQVAYQSKEQFENLVGRPVRGFNSASETFNVFWVLYPDGTAKWARVYSVSVMGEYYGIGASCTSIEHPRLYARVWTGRGAYPAERRYFFLNN